ncbi:hypothetical protein C0V97_10315 [Asaia sp. W19]|uniref:hypothetical protein n=1 Tax=unclassified Asaia TaxID=2685023 RepID=UPI000F8F6454|nr:hypothetical protein [Asaia sp. W19]RUT25697.1 hypothetical protein C0V97_10315 [Asaia sp. W19]
MGEWEKAQATKNAIVGFAKHDPEISVHLGALYGVADIAKDEITIINDWGGEVSFPRSEFERLGGYLAGVMIEEAAHD